MKPNDSINQCWFIRWLLFYELSFVLVLRRNWAFIRCKSPSRLSWNNKLNPWTTFREKNDQKYVSFSEPLHFSRTYLFLVSNWKIFWQMFILPLNIVFFFFVRCKWMAIIWFDLIGTPVAVYYFNDYPIHWIDRISSGGIMFDGVKFFGWNIYLMESTSISTRPQLFHSRSL